MEALTIYCTCCGAPLDYNVTEPILTCEYCDSQFENPYYDENAPVIRTRKSDDADEVLSIVCGKCTISAGDVTCGSPITGGKRLERAREHFHIPDEDHVYMIFDGTIFGSCKKGFALCSSGFYCCTEGLGYISWDDFIHADISFDTNTFVNEFVFVTGTDENRLLTAFLQDLQDQL